MATITERLTGIAGVPETLLSPDLLAVLPDSASAPAPWLCRFDAVLWFGRGGRAASQALPPQLNGRGLGVVGGFVRYHDTPIGPYDEVLGIVGSWSGPRPWGHVALMAVDSLPSLVAGRNNWAMPKTLASFDGEIGNGQRMTAIGSDSLPWSIQATAHSRGPTVAVSGSAMARQVFAGGAVGESQLRLRGRAQPALVRVRVSSRGGLGRWLRPGAHAGIVIKDGTFELPSPAFRGLNGLG